MCVVSMVGDYYQQSLPQKYPETYERLLIGVGVTTYPTGPSRDEFNELRREVLEMKELLKRAKAYDEKNGEPDCEMEEKVALLKKFAELVGVELDEIFK